MVMHRAKRILSVALIAVVLTFAVCSSAQVTFERTYGGEGDDWGRAVEQTSDGGYIVAGSSFSLSAGDDVYLIRTDSLGDVLWDRTYGVGIADQGLSVEQTLDGGYIATGCAGCFSAGSDIYLVKTDSLGDSLWARTYDSGVEEYGWSVCQTTDGGYVAAGFTLPSWDIRLLKTDSLGDIVWDTTFEGGGLAYSVQQTLDGGYVIGGHNSGNVYLLKTDSLGSTIWDASFGGSGDEYGFCVQQTADEGYVVAGCTDCWTDSGDVYVIKTDSLGNAEWETAYGGAGSCGYSIGRTTNGSYIVAGCIHCETDSADVYAIMLDSLGNPLWDATYGGMYADCGWSGSQTSDGGYVLVGFTWSFGSGRSDVYLIKTDENGVTGIHQGRRAFEAEHSTRASLQSQPNPFRCSTLISYCLAAAAQVTLRIYDITGRLVETLVNERQQPGKHQVRWDRKTNPSGVYFYRLEAGESAETRKMVVVE